MIDEHESNKLIDNLAELDIKIEQLEEELKKQHEYRDHLIEVLLNAGKDLYKNYLVAKYNKRNK